MNGKKSFIIVTLMVVGIGIMSTGFNLLGQEVGAGTNKTEKVNPENQKKKGSKDNTKASPYILSEKSVQSIITINLIMIFILKFLCLTFGFCAVYLGYDLLKRGVRGEFKFSAKISGAKADLASASPGLLFLLLGIILIGFALYVKKEIPIQYSLPTGDPINVVTAPLPTKDEY